MMATHLQKAVLRMLAFAFLAALVMQCNAELTGTIAANQIVFMGGKPTAADGTGTIKNEKGETVASGKLLTNSGDMELLATQGAAFVYVVQQKTPPTDWPAKERADVAVVDFDGKDRWTLKDDHFLFTLELGGNFRANILVDKSLLSSSSITFPEGSYLIWGYSITVGAGGGKVIFKQGHPVGGDNSTVETPEGKKLDFPRKGK